MQKRITVSSSWRNVEHKRWCGTEFVGFPADRSPSRPSHKGFAATAGNVTDGRLYIFAVEQHPGKKLVMCV